MPENCTKCIYYKTCRSHYGGLGCEYREAISCTTSS